MDLVSETVSSSISVLFLTIKPQVIIILRLPSSINIILTYSAGYSPFESASRPSIHRHGFIVLCNSRPR